MAAFQEVTSDLFHGGLLSLLAVVALFSLLLFRRVPESRRTLSQSIALLLGSLCGLALSNALKEAGSPAAPAALRELFLLVEGMAVIRISGLFLFHLLMPALKFSPPSILEDMTVISCYLAYGLVRLRMGGLDISGIVTTSAVITAVVAFSVQDSLGNILGGIALQLENSLQVGDWIKVDDVVGRVVDIRWRSSLIETRNWETVVIPNSLLMKNKFHILGRRRGRPGQWRRWVWFNVGFSVPPSRVISLVEQALIRADIPLVAKDPPPNCVMMEYSDSAARYAVRYWLTDLAADDPTDSAVRVHIYAALKRGGVEPCIPEQYVHVAKEGEKRETARRDLERQKRVELLRRIDLFRTLSEEEIALVAGRLGYTPFARGDVITQQGATAHWLYIITAGSAEIVYSAPDGRRTQLAMMDASKGAEVFGEMGLMTGEPRTASVIARSDVECYRLDKEAFAGIVRSRPEMAEDFSRVIAQRRERFERLLHELDARPFAGPPHQRESDLLRKIRAFFGLREP